MTILTLLHNRLEEMGYKIEVINCNGVKFNVVDPMDHIITIDAKDLANQFGTLRFFHCETEDTAINNIIETVIRCFE
jgi:Ni,Fe-hydrogenase maturation factor